MSVAFPELDSLRERFSSLSLDEMLARAQQDYGSSLTIASSLGLEDVVILDAAARVRGASGVPFEVFLLDTGRLPNETFELLDRLEAKYALGIRPYMPDYVAVEDLVRRQGMNGFYTSVERRHACCEARKLAPLRRALEGKAAWVTGVRREQSVTRAGVEVVEIDSSRVKLNPLASWSFDDVWRYVREHDVPYSALHDRGYPSVGCAPCTRAIEPGEDARSGRWWWEQPGQRECGLHTPRAVALRAAAAGRR